MSSFLYFWQNVINSKRYNWICSLYCHIAQCFSFFVSWICNRFKDYRIRWRLFSNEYSSLSASSERTKQFLQKSWASALSRCISCRNNWEGSKKRGCSCFQGFQGFQATVKRLWWRESVKACLFKWRETVPYLLWQGVRHLCEVYRKFLELFPIFVWRLALPQLSEPQGSRESDMDELDWRWLLGRVHN